MQDSCRLRRFTLALLLCGLYAAPQGFTPAAAAATPATAPAPTAAAPTAAAPVAVADLKVPDGFVVERVAAPPFVEHPMSACFDDRGRLYVTENAGVNHDFKQLEKDPPSKVLRLEDTDGDGTFDKRTVFADRFTFPSGVLWHAGAVYVTSPPGLWKLRESDLDYFGNGGDGVADERKQIVTGFGSIGNAADLHGPYLGPEGWLYFCDGRNGHDVKLGDGTTWTGKAACVYRCRTDGSGLEVVFGGGFDNPVEVAFTRAGEPLVNVNLLHAQPHRVDAILFGIEGGNYPYDNVWRELKRTGDFLPSVGDLGWVATSGFMRYTGAALGERYVGRYFSTEFNPHRVRSHGVDRDGAGFRVTHEDFLTCEHPDFHPTDVLEDADGSLLVIDTGGWFRIGCPQSQVAKPDVRGAIYRVRRKDVPHRPAAHPAADASAVAPRERPLPDDERRIRETRLAYLKREGLPPEALVERLKDDNLAVRREAATALGRLHRDSSVAPLLDAAAATGGDRFLDHAITFALIRAAARDATVAGLAHPSPAARRAALVALDQMKGGNLKADVVVPHLASDDARLRDAALAIATAHPQWAEQIVPTLRAALTKGEIAPADAPALRAAIVAFAKAPAVQALVGELLGDGSVAVPVRRLLLQAVSESGVTPLPAGWVEPLRSRLGDAEEAVAAQAVEAARVAGSDALDADLLRLARDAGRPPGLRVAALAALAPRAKSVDAADFQLLRAELAADGPPLSRLAAARALAALPLSDERLADLAPALADAGPLELPALLAAFERSADPGVGRVLVGSLGKAKSLAGLTAAALTQALSKYPPAVRDAAAPLLAKLNPDAAAQQARLAELAPLLAGGGGDPGRGQSVFFGKAAACATCHAVAGQGAAVGPDLSKIGSIRAPRDLLESVVFPSASFARGYESFVVQTTANATHAGVLAAETADAILLRTPAELRIPRASVKAMRQDRVSIMPQGLDAQLSNQELADLLAFLQSLK